MASRASDFESMHRLASRRQHSAAPSDATYLLSQGEVRTSLDGGPWLLRAMMRETDSPALRVGRRSVDLTPDDSLHQADDQRHLSAPSVGR
jgi:hypothetical protein